MKLARVAASSAAVVAGLGLICVAALWWLYATEGGARFVAERLVTAADGALTIGQVRGSLNDSLELTDVRYRDAAREIVIASVAVRLGLSELLSGALDIDELRTSVVEYRELGTGAGDPVAADTQGVDGATAPAPFSLPISIALARASVAGIDAVLADGSEVELGRVTLSARAGGTAVDVQRFETTLQGFFVSAQGNFSWAEGFDIDGIVSWSGELQNREWLGSAELEGRWPTLTIEQELLEPFALTASGELVLTEAPRFDLVLGLADVGEASIVGGLDADATNLQLDIAAIDLAPGAVIPGWPGSLSLRGSLNAALEPSLAVATDDLVIAAAIGGALLEIDFAGSVDADRALTVDRLVAVLGDNRISVEGMLAETFDLAIAADLADLSQVAAVAEAEALEALDRALGFVTALRGRASADLAVSGNAESALVAGDIAIDAATLLDLPLELALDFSARTPLEALLAPAGAALPALDIERFELALGATSLAASGTIGRGILGAADSEPALGLAVTAQFGDLAELAALAGREEVRALTGLEAALPAIAGRADAELAVGGSLARPVVDADVGFTRLDLGMPWTADGTLRAGLDLGEGGRVTLALDASTAAFDLAAGAEGRLVDDGWQGAIGTLAIEEPRLGTWSLAAPAGLTLAGGRIALERACLVNAGSELCAEWRQAGGERIRISADAFELAVLAPLLPPAVSLAGVVDLDIELASLTDAPAGTLLASGTAITLDVATSETDSFTTRFETVAIDAELDDWALTLEAGLTSETTGRAAIAMRAADIRDRAAAVDGSIDILWPDLAALSLLSPDVGEVGGTLAIAVDLGGTATAPELAGNATVRDGRIAIPAWDVLIERIEAEALSFDGGSLDFAGSGYIDDAEIMLTGRTELDPQAGWPTTLAIRGDNVPLSQRPDAFVVASPEFEASIRLPLIEVSGTVVVDEALIAVEDLPVQAVRVSQDSVVHGRAEDTEVRPLDLTANITVELGENVRYTGSNLSTDLSGTLRVQYESGFSPTASGTVGLDGTYDAYGQSLDLESGELLFAGPLDNPALDVRAVRRIGTTTVGIELGGTLLEPEVSIFSDPAMSEANALSYLMFGRPLSATDDSDAATLESTALALGLQQALPAIQRVGETIGLDELSIQPTGLDAGALMAGKYLSPKLYMSYSYGLFNRLGGFLMRYEINDRFSLETRSGDEKSMDLLYSIEKE